MSRIRTIKAAFEEVKRLDPNTSLTEYRIRQLVVSGEIPSKKVGTKYTLNLEDLLLYFESDSMVE